jgi:hypothetical protein
MLQSIFGLLIIFGALLPLHCHQHWEHSNKSIEYGHKAHDILSRFIEDYEGATVSGNRRSKRQVRVKPKYSLGSPQLLHGPEYPQFQQLMGQMNKIIPGKFVVTPKGMRKNPQLNFILNTLDFVKEMKAEGAIAPRHQGSVKRMESLINTMIKSGVVQEDKMQLLMKLMIGLFDNLHQGQDARPRDPMSQAPFTKLGQDCFSDVNHKDISIDVRKTALALTKYLEERIKESDKINQDFNDVNELMGNRVKYKTDAVLTHMVTILAKIHRATMRNWQHILVLVGNFAYIPESGMEDILHEG